MDEDVVTMINERVEAARSDTRGASQIVIKKSRVADAAMIHLHDCEVDVVADVAALAVVLFGGWRTASETSIDSVRMDGDVVIMVAVRHSC